MHKDGLGGGGQPASWIYLACPQAVSHRQVRCNPQKLIEHSESAHSTSRWLIKSFLSQRSFLPLPRAGDPELHNLVGRYLAWSTRIYTSHAKLQRSVGLPVELAFKNFGLSACDAIGRRSRGHRGQVLPGGAGGLPVQAPGALRLRHHPGQKFRKGFGRPRGRRRGRPGGGVLTEVSQARGNGQSIASGYAVGVGVLLARLCGQPATPSGSLTMPIRARSPVRQADPERTFDVLLARVTFRLLFCVLVPTELLQAVTGARYPW